MLDIKYIRENTKKVKDGTKAKQLDSKLVDVVLKRDNERRKLLSEVEEIRAKRNVAAKSKNIEEGRRLKIKLQKIEPKLKKVNKDFEIALKQIPNPPASDVKEGKDESENEIIKTWRKPKKFSFKPKDHLDLGEALDIIDVKRASKVSGSRFGYLKGDAVLLSHALMSYARETLMKEGFIPVIPPVLINKEMMGGMGYLEHGGEDDMYILEKDDLVLVATSEQSIGPMHKDEVIDVEKPLRYVGFSTCFRREAGSYGKDTRGILRVHQFDKAEMFSFTKPDSSDKEHERLLSFEEKLMQGLEIPYQVSKMCSGDLGAPASRKYDIEAWMPGQGKYREVTSTSNTTDFQSRRLNIRFKDKNGLNFVHMLNGTGFSTRPVIAIMENYQKEDGSIEVPKVLQKWVGKKQI
jgi:seryl-tRNA synthetase